MYTGGSAQLALILGRLFGQDVALESLSALNTATSADFKPLSGSALGFHLRHLKLRNVMAQVD